MLAPVLSLDKPTRAEVCCTAVFLLQVMEEKDRRIEMLKSQSKVCAAADWESCPGAARRPTHPRI